jgi:outer membrane immunogenic protein
MKLNVVGCALLFALGTIEGAAAADVLMPLKVPPMPAAFNWTGCYLGGYLGGAGQNGNTVFTDLGNTNFPSYSGGVSAARLIGPHAWNVDLGGSVIGGGTIGCNWQPSGSSFVFGVEGEGGYMHLSGQAFDPNTLLGTQTVLDVLGSAKVGDWYGMMTARLGYAWGNVLLYAKGGVAFVSNRASVTDACNAAGCGNWLIATLGSSSASANGTVGGGLEWAFAQNWSIKGEYMFIGMGNSADIVSCGTATAPSGANVGGGPFCFNHSFAGIHTGKVGLNYRF